MAKESGRVRWASPFFQTSFMLSWHPGGKTLAKYLHAGLYVYGLGKKIRVENYEIDGGGYL